MELEFDRLEFQLNIFQPRCFTCMYWKESLASKLNAQWLVMYWLLFCLEQRIVFGMTLIAQMSYMIELLMEIWDKKIFKTFHLGISHVSPLVGYGSTIHITISDLWVFWGMVYWIGIFNKNLYPKGKIFNKNSSRPPSITLDVKINQVYKKNVNSASYQHFDMEIK